MDEIRSTKLPEEYPLSPAEPGKMPDATLWPIAAALGSFFLFWGMIASPIISLIGVIILGFSIAGWIQDMNYE
jgi:hypothetical protein